MSTALKAILIPAAIIIAMFLSYLGLFLVIVFYHEFKPPERIQLFRAEYEGLAIEMVKLRKIRLGATEVQYILFLNGQPAWSNGVALDKKIAQASNWPKPVLREDLEKITAMRYVLPASIEDWEGLDVWINPAQFSREDFERLCDFIETRYRDDPANAFEGQISGDLTFFFRWMIYADVTQFSNRTYTALKPGNRKELVVVYLDGRVAHYFEDEEGDKNLLCSGVLDANTYHINFKANSDEGHPATEQTYYQDFVDERGYRLTDRFSISIDNDG